MNTQAFYATFHDVPGILTKPQDHLLFVAETTDVAVRVTAADAPFLIVLGAIAPATAQYCLDAASGGAARIACTRDHLEVGL